MANDSTPCGKRSARDCGVIAGFVFQFGQLVPELTAEENVALPLLLGGMRREEASSSRGAGSNVSTSGGWNATAPARCPAASPSAWPGPRPRRPSRRAVRRRTDRVARLAERRAGHGPVDRAAREQGSTVILVTHEPRVAAYADREVIVRDGRVAPPPRQMADDPARPASDARKRTRSRAARPRHGGSRRPRRRLLLACLAGVNGLHAQTDRGAWLDSAAQASGSTSSTEPGCGGYRAPISSPARRSTGSTWPPPDRTLRSHRGLRTSRGRVSTTPRPRSRLLRSEPANRAARPVSRATRSGPSAPLHCRRRTR